MGCSVRPAMDDWVRRGCNAQLPPELALHARICRTCWQFVTQVMLTRQMAAGIQVHRVGPTRLHEIRAILNTETRRGLHLEAAARIDRLGSWFAVVLVGALAWMTSVAAMLVAKRVQSARTVAAVRQTQSTVVVALPAGARGSATSRVADAPYELEDGQAEFEVAWQDGESEFWVIAGDSLVDAQRAYFRLNAPHASLVRIEAVTGLATVRKDGAIVRTVGPGQDIDLNCGGNFASQPHKRRVHAGVAYQSE